jgi:hypothetical protein
MATKTTAASGNWTATGTWGAAVPANGDTVNINHPVIFDGDYSSYSGTGFVLTVNSTLTASTATGLHHLPASGIAGTGTIKAGTAAVPLVAGSKFVIDLCDASQPIASGITLQLYGDEPATSYVSLTASAAAEETGLSIDTNVTAEWATGDAIAIVNPTTTETQLTTIAALTTTGLGLTDALTADKAVGANIHWLKRNILINNASGTIMTDGSNAILNNVAVDATDVSGVAAFVDCNGMDFDGLIWGDNTQYGFQGGGDSEIGGFLIYLNRGLNAAHGAKLTNPDIIACTAGVYGSFGIKGQAEFYNCAYGGQESQFDNFHETDYNCTYPFYNCNGTFAYSYTDDTTPFTWATTRKNDRIQVARNTAGTPASYSKNGYVTWTTSVVAPNRTGCFDASVTSGRNTWIDEQVFVKAGRKLIIRAFGAVSATTATGKIQIIDPMYDPMIDSSNQVLDEFTYSSTTWANHNLVYQPTTSKLVLVRFLGTGSASVHAYGYWEVKLTHGKKSAAR